jgi:hypothetical protein
MMQNGNMVMEYKHVKSLLKRRKDLQSKGEKGEKGELYL